jgi:hypothetical protein
MTEYDSPYVRVSSWIDCKKPSSSGEYGRSYYSLTPTCDTMYPWCDNRSYSAYAFSPLYMGYYDNCFPSTHTQPSCDLKYLNASPSTILAGWKVCCDDKSIPCSQTCHMNHVVSSVDPSITPPTPSPSISSPPSSKK